MHPSFLEHGGFVWYVNLAWRSLHPQGLWTFDWLPFSCSCEQSRRLWWHLPGQKKPPFYHPTLCWSWTFPQCLLVVALSPRLKTVTTAPGKNSSDSHIVGWLIALICLVRLTSRCSHLLRVMMPHLTTYLIELIIVLFISVISSHPWWEPSDCGWSRLVNMRMVQNGSTPTPHYSMTHQPSRVITTAIR